MSKRTKAQEAERTEAIARLREWIKPGDTVYTILDHVSASGMSRAIRVVIPSIDRGSAQFIADACVRLNDAGAVAACNRDLLTEELTDIERNAHAQRDAPIDFIHPNWAVGKALDLRHWKRHGREQDALVVGGCGMDMGFHLVYELSHTLYGDGYACLGKGKCPSNYHVNHRDRIRCEGVGTGDDRQSCYKPSAFGRYKAPEDWPELTRTVQGVDVSIGLLAACIRNREDHGEYVICPTCQGAGDVPNPEGPERWDLVHTDGYALRHRWL